MQCILIANVSSMSLKQHSALSAAHGYFWQDIRRRSLVWAPGRHQEVRVGWSFRLKRASCGEIVGKLARRVWQKLAGIRPHGDWWRESDPLTYLRWFAESDRLLFALVSYPYSFFCEIMTYLFVGIPIKMLVVNWSWTARLKI